MFHAPVWATWLILAALPVILGTVLYFWGEERPDNTVVHHHDDEPPDSADGDEPGDVLLAA